MTIKHYIIGALVTVAPACATTDERPANVLIAGLDGPGNAPGNGHLMVHDWLPLSGAGHDRLRIDGHDVIMETDTGWDYVEFLDRGYSVGIPLPGGGHQLEILDSAGNVRASGAATVATRPDDATYRVLTSAFVWGATDVWQAPPVSQPAPDTIRVAVRSLLAEPLKILRCVAPAPCNVLATLAPGGTYEQTLPSEDGDLIGEFVSDPNTKAILGSLRFRDDGCTSNDTFLPGDLTEVVSLADPQVPVVVGHDIVYGRGCPF